MDKNIPADKRTLELIKQIANSLEETIQVTTDVPTNHDDHKVPMLDIKVWFNENEKEVQYNFFQKEMKNKVLLKKTSALPYRQKLAILTQEVVRRLHNTKEELPVSVKNEILEDFMKTMKLSGFNEKERFDVLKSGKEAFEKLKQKAKAEGRSLFRPKGYKKQERKKEKKLKKTKWFAREESRYSTVIFINPTSNSELLKLLEKTEASNKISEDKRIKFVEKNGSKIIDILKKQDPFASNCEKHDCLACVSSDPSNNKLTNCRKNNVMYEMQCLNCKNKGNKRTYTGESCKNVYIRGVQHMNLYKQKHKNSFMWKHVKNEHDNEKEDICLL